MEPTMPATLGEALATEPVWLQVWVAALVGVHLPALAFVVGREAGRWRVRVEPVLILASFAAAGLVMDWLYGQVGYVRLLGLAHLVGWTPAFVWVLSRRHTIGSGSLFSKWVRVYLIIAGTSLVIDLVDVVRYLVGDGQLLNRWG